MNYTVNYSEIFFDRYQLTENEKKESAEYIITKAFDEKAERYTFDGNILTAEDYITEKIGNILKREFFIFLDEEIVEKVAEVQESKDEVTLRAEEYIRKMYLYDTLTIAQVCEHVNIKRGSLDKLFVKKYNMTMKEYLKNLRVKRAEELIIQGEKEYVVAELCGFGSVKTLQRAFKDVYNQTPSQRRAHLTEKI